MKFLSTEEKSTVSYHAKELIKQGANPEHLVHFIYYPDNSAEAGNVQSISTPITYEDFLEGGLSAKYYKLQDLASL